MYALTGAAFTSFLIFFLILFLLVAQLGKLCVSVLVHECIWPGERMPKIFT